MVQQRLTGFFQLVRKSYGNKIKLTGFFQLAIHAAQKDLLHLMK